MQFENPLTFVRSLKGAPASILWAFFFTRQAMTALELQEWTGYKGDNVTVALRLLVNLGWLTARTPRGPWCLADGRQLPLMDIAQALPNGFAKGESDLIGVSSSSSSRRGFVTSYLPQEQDEHDESDLIGVMAALDAAGIREPKRSRLAQLPHVTPDLIRAHVEQARREGMPLGTAIHRIEFNWSVDLSIVQRTKSPNGHDRLCRCAECREGRNNVAMGTHCPDCWQELETDCTCAESEEQ